MTRALVLFLIFPVVAWASSVASSGGLPGVTVSSTPGGANLCLISGSTTTASWGSCAAGSGVAGTWLSSTGNVVTTNGASTAQDSGTALTALAPKDSPAFTTQVTCSYATASTVPYLDASKHLVSSSVTPTELGYVSGVTSAIQTQLNAKAPTDSPNFTTKATFGNYHLEPFEHTTTFAATTAIDWSTGSAQVVTLTGAVTFTFSNPVTGGAYVLHVIQDATGSRAMTWPAAVTWLNSSNTAPSAGGASKVLLVNLYYDGTTYWGSYAGNY